MCVTDVVERCDLFWNHVHNGTSPCKKSFELCIWQIWQHYFQQYIGTRTEKGQWGCWDETHRQHTYITRILPFLTWKSCGEIFTIRLVC